MKQQRKGGEDMKGGKGILLKRRVASTSTDGLPHYPHDQHQKQDESQHESRELCRLCLYSTLDEYSAGPAMGGTTTPLEPLDRGCLFPSDSTSDKKTITASRTGKSQREWERRQGSWIEACEHTITVVSLVYTSVESAGARLRVSTAV